MPVTDIENHLSLADVWRTIALFNKTDQSIIAWHKISLIIYGHSTTALVFQIIAEKRADQLNPR